MALAESMGWIHIHRGWKLWHFRGNEWRLGCPGRLRIGEWILTDTSGVTELFPMDDDPSNPNVVPLRGTGILPSHQIKAMIDDNSVVGLTEPISADQIQPASLDLRLGAEAYRVRASF
jgi:hypothetical protein